MQKLIIDSFDCQIFDKAAFELQDRLPVQPCHHWDFFQARLIQYVHQFEAVVWSAYEADALDLILQSVVVFQ